MTSWTIFIILWAILGVAALVVKNHPIVSLFLAIGITCGSGYMIAIGETGGALVTLCGMAIVAALQFVPTEHTEHNA